MKDVNFPVSRLRSVAAQFMASMAPNLLLLDLGMAVSFATIALPHLLNAPEGLSLTDNQASWFGSIPFLTQPVGALISGPIGDYFGRKKATCLVNIPHVIAWILLYFTWNLPSLFAAIVLLGFGTGVMEAPIYAYVSEISEPSIRGPLCTVSSLFTNVGVLITYSLGAVVHWRVAALICLSVPVLTMILAAFVVPDTPVWLLSQGKEKDALESLCYLRGWTKPANVRDEFDQLFEYSKTIDCCVICNKERKNNSKENLEKSDTECEHNKMNFIKRFFVKFNFVMLCKETLRPLLFIFLYFTFVVMGGLYPIKPYMVNISGALGMAVESSTVVMMVGVLSFVASIFVIFSIRYTGKRKLGISAMLGSTICCTVMSIYAATHLDSNVFSYDTATYPEEKSIIPVIFFYGLTFCTAVNVAWILLGEVFPFRSRASSQGIAAAWNYIVTFVAAKILIDLETNFKLTGTFAIYAAFSLVGTIYLYFYMPETEGKSLQEIETLYQREHRFFADDCFINKFKKPVSSIQRST